MSAAKNRNRQRRWAESHRVFHFSFRLNTIKRRKVCESLIQGGGMGFGKVGGMGFPLPLFQP